VSAAAARASGLDVELYRKTVLIHGARFLAAALDGFGRGSQGRER
jgi:hypothetical protein